MQELLKIKSDVGTEQDWEDMLNRKVARLCNLLHAGHDHKRITEIKMVLRDAHAVCYGRSNLTDLRISVEWYDTDALRIYAAYLKARPKSRVNENQIDNPNQYPKSENLLNNPYK